MDICISLPLPLTSQSTSYSRGCGLSNLFLPVNLDEILKRIQTHQICIDKKCPQTFHRITWMDLASWWNEGQKCTVQNTKKSLRIRVVFMINLQRYINDPYGLYFRFIDEVVVIAYTLFRTFTDRYNSWTDNLKAYIKINTGGYYAYLPTWSLQLPGHPKHLYPQVLQRICSRKTFWKRKNVCCIKFFSRVVRKQHNISLMTKKIIMLTILVCVL